MRQNRSGVMNETDEDTLEPQVSGHLYKMATSGKNRWRRRFFVLLDGFLMYYPERKTPFTYFEFHPKVSATLSETKLSLLNCHVSIGGTSTWWL